MSQFTVVYDACVLYPAPLRSFLMYLAVTDLYHARWSNDIHEEWMRNVVKDHANINREQVERIRDLMNLHVRDCLVTGYDLLIGALTLPDPNDGHVLAAAIHCGADTIVTFNLKDFPEDALKPYGIEAQHPEEFLTGQLDLAPNLVCSAAKKAKEQPEETADGRRRVSRVAGTPGTTSNGLKPSGILGPHLNWIVHENECKVIEMKGFLLPSVASDRHPSPPSPAEKVQSPSRCPGC